MRTLLLMLLFLISACKDDRNFVQFTDPKNTEEYAACLAVKKIPFEFDGNFFYVSRKFAREGKPTYETRKPDSTEFTLHLVCENTQAPDTHL